MIAPIEVHALAEGMPYSFVRNSDGRGNCIWTTKLALAVLRKEGIDCKPLACNLLAFNAEGVALYDKGVPMAFWPQTAWSVGVVCERQVESDSKLEPGRVMGFGGHLVVAGDGWFLDLTAEQVHRPDHGIIISGPFIGPYDPARGVRAELERGGVVEYQWRSQFKSWRTVNAWRADLDPEHVSGARGRLWREREKLRISQESLIETDQNG